jgi:hypothetical protein
MTNSNVSLGNLLDQLSEDRINLVVDADDIKAGHPWKKKHKKHKKWKKRKKHKKRHKCWSSSSCSWSS